MAKVVRTMAKAAKNAQWLAPAEWELVQASVPIACVDVLAVRQHAQEAIRVGLIRRETPHQRERWCLIGGRLALDESLEEAISRELYGALGPGIVFRLPPDPQPVYVAQYFTHRREVGSFDPRQHAVGLIFAVQVGGAIHAQAEALDFAWFISDRLPPSDEIGFGQEPIIRACLARLDRPTDPQWNTGP